MPVLFLCLRGRGKQKRTNGTVRYRKVQKGGECLARNDWNALRTEYVTTDISLPKMHEKHGTSLSALKDRCAKEGWVAAREDYRAEVGQRVVQKAVDAEVSRLEGLQENAGLISSLINMNLVSLTAAQLVAEGVTEDGVKMVKDLTAALKQISEVMKDLYMIPVKKEEDEEAGGVIFLPPVLERGEEDGNHMDSTAEAN